jgi:hypothetical protein
MAWATFVTGLHFAKERGEMLPIKGFWCHIEGITKDGLLVLKPRNPTGRLWRKITKKEDSNEQLPGEEAEAPEAEEVKDPPASD